MPSRFDSRATSRLPFLPEREIAAVADRLLREHLAHAARSRFYAAAWAAAGIDPASVAGFADLARLPFTTKADLEAANDDFLAVDPREAVDYCQTSGTTGRPVAMLQTRSDLERLAYNEEISFAAAGIGPDDRVLVGAAIDRCFMAGLAYFLGLVNLGAKVIRGGSSSIPFLADLALRYRPTAIVGVPTLALGLGKRLRRDGVDPRSIGVRLIVCIGEPVRAADLSLAPLGARLAETWGAQVLTTYASTEMATAFADCAAGCGGHVHPDLIAVEIVDDDGNRLSAGTPGEVVVTPLGVTGMPLVRFRTGDLAALHDAPCRCGRNTPRLGPIIGRKSQMLKIKGTTVYPPAIFAVLGEIRGISGGYLEVHDEYDLSDRVRVVAGTTDDTLTPEGVAELIAARIRVKPEVVLVPPAEITRKTVQETKRKPVTFFDYRSRS
jgi:phenylacetate-CoA ligase